METTLASGIEYTYSRSEIDSKIADAIEKIEKVIKENNYQVSGDIEKYYEIKWKNLSQNQMKKIQKYCYWIERSEKPSLRKINTFLGLLSRLFEIEKVRIKPSVKEEKIQNARKEWIKARNEADRLLKIYKLEKGNFYK
jgi:hypothetical protein